MSLGRLTLHVKNTHKLSASGSNIGQVLRESREAYLACKRHSRVSVVYRIARDDVQYERVLLRGGLERAPPRVHVVEQVLYTAQHSKTCISL